MFTLSKPVETSFETNWVWNEKGVHNIYIYIFCRNSRWFAIILQYYSNGDLAVELFKLVTGSGMIKFVYLMQHEALQVPSFHRNAS